MTSQKINFLTDDNRCWRSNLSKLNEGSFVRFKNLDELREFEGKMGAPLYETICGMVQIRWEMGEGGGLYFTENVENGIYLRRVADPVINWWTYIPFDYACFITELYSREDQERLSRQHADALSVVSERRKRGKR